MAVDVFTPLGCPMMEGKERTSCTYFGAILHKDTIFWYLDLGFQVSRLGSCIHRRNTRGIGQSCHVTLHILLRGLRLEVLCLDTPKELDGVRLDVFKGSKGKVKQSFTI